MDMDVGTFTRSIRIGRPIDEVWSVLADIGSIADWNPGVVASRTTTGQLQGEGAGRFCDLGRRMHLDEVVTEWLPPQRITFSIVETNLPFSRADIGFTLVEVDDGTEVAVSSDYSLRFGPVGRIMDAVMVRRTYARGMEGLLAGLQRHLEDPDA